MAWIGPAVGKDHCPGQAGYTAIQLAVNKVSYAPEAEADRHRDTREVCDLPKVPALPAARKPRGCDDADESSVKRHAALPDRKNRQGVSQVARQIVKQDVAEAASDHHADDEVEQQIVQVVGRKVQFAIFCKTLEDEVADDERQHVHQ